MTGSPLARCGTLLALAATLLCWVPEATLLGQADRELLLESIEPLSGRAYVAPLPDMGPGDHDGRSRVRLYEDGVLLAPHAPHKRIAERPGLSSHWGDTLRFSTTDGSDPRSNGRRYRAVLPARSSEGPPLVTAALLALLLIGWRLRVAGMPAEAGTAAAAPAVPAADGDGDGDGDDDDDGDGDDTPAGPTDAAVAAAPRPDAAPATTQRTRVPAALLAVLAAALLVYGALVQAFEVNTDPRAGDQQSYVDYARKLDEPAPGQVLERNRMPAFPWLMSLSRHGAMDDHEVWQRGRLLNTALALLGLTLVYLTLRPRVGRGTAACIVLLAGSTVFVYKAGWAQAELTFYSGSLLLFVVLARLLRRPTPGLALAAGVLAGLVHLTKAAALAAVVLYVALAALDGLLRWRRRAEPGRPLLSAALLTAAFLGTLWPYISTSKRVFGHYFYNVNSTFYMWYDSWAECLAGTHAHGDATGWPDMPADELPSASRWFAEHGWDGTVERLGNGLDVLGRILSQHEFGFLPFLQLVPWVLLLCALLWPRRSLAAARRHGLLVLFGAGHLLGYGLLCVWYAQVVAQPRFLLAGFLPLLTAGALVLRRVGDGAPLVGRRLRLDLTVLVHLALLGRLSHEWLAILLDRVGVLDGSI